MIGSTSILAAAFAASLAGAQTTRKVDEPCSGDNWDRGVDLPPNAPAGPYPLAGQQVYIQDPSNFCIGLPNPNDPFLIANYYSQGRNPTIVSAEGHMQVYCVGKLAPGALPMLAGGISAATVIKNSTDPLDSYMQVNGYLNCDVLGIDCSDGTGGQYDSVPYRNCGKEPFSGVDAGGNPGFSRYVEQAGNGIFCMRTCNGGDQFLDACNVKNDTAGCSYTMDFEAWPISGFTMVDMTGLKFNQTKFKTTSTSTSTATATATATLVAAGTGTAEATQAATAKVVTTAKSAASTVGVFGFLSAFFGAALL
ncbi:hypothetical protein CcCBS67573_g06027 [Chytriomyces confervae]|uniref:Uncharacterized protein n=1 Tax=Chytriomyces confervae TaxID=246404 RepID=A0A507F6P7_9FUNG|nr:hypothetical protein CcCBS67573_g06027 [Chytriomyces confervae]